MFLFKAHSIHKDIRKAISCKFDQIELASLFYGSIENEFIKNLASYKNTDEEYILYKKINIINNNVFSEQERNNLYFFAKVRNILSAYKMNGISIFSHVFLHMFEFKNQLEIADQIWNMEVIKNSKNQHFYIQYLFWELSLSGGQEVLTQVSRKRLFDFYDLNYKISSFEKDFIKVYGHLINEKKLDNSFIKKYILGSQKDFEANMNLNIDKLGSCFSMFDDMMLLLMLFHLEKDNIMSSVNGSMMIHKHFIDNKRTIKSKVADTKKVINELISEISYGNHELKRCSDKEVYKVYRSMCYGKM